MLDERFLPCIFAYMSSVLFRDIDLLVQTHTQPPEPIRGKQMNVIPEIEQAWLLVKEGRVHSFGSMTDAVPNQADRIMDCRGRLLLPSFCDSHTHLVFAGSREEEFADRIKGLSYEAIAKRGGGILNSAKRLRTTSEDALYEQSAQRLREVIKAGTGAIEIKSGYGLTLEAELKMLRVIRRLKEDFPIPIKATFLAAHALPNAFKSDRAAYMRQVIKEWIPAVAEAKLADYIDVFCEQIAFSVEEMEEILAAAEIYNLKPKVHVNQFTSLGGIETAVNHQAISVDHLEVMEGHDITALQRGNTIATLLPFAPYFLRDPYPPAREMLDADLLIALASDFNPGSAPCGDLKLALSMACIQMRMMPEEAINALTVNGAHAMELGSEVGAIAPGMRANLILTKPVPSLAYLPYRFGYDWVDKVFLNGEQV